MDGDENEERPRLGRGPAGTHATGIQHHRVVTTLRTSHRGRRSPSAPSGCPSESEKLLTKSSTCCTRAEQPNVLSRLSPPRLHRSRTLRVEGLSHFMDTRPDQRFTTLPETSRSAAGQPRAQDVAKEVRGCKSPLQITDLQVRRASSVKTKEGVQRCPTDQ